MTSQAEEQEEVITYDFFRARLTSGLGHVTISWFGLDDWNNHDTHEQRTNSRYRPVSLLNRERGCPSWSLRQHKPKWLQQRIRYDMAKKRA